MAVVGGTKLTAAVAALSERLLRTEVGTRFPRVSDLAAGTGAGDGTMFKALHLLRDAGAVQASLVQRQGTTIEALDYAALWRLSGRQQIRGVLPMPISEAMQALAVALERSLDRLGLPVVLLYREGAQRRVEAVSGGHADFTVMSAPAAATFPTMAVARRFDRGSYYGDSGIFRLHRVGDDVVRRVGVDMGSPDHCELVASEFPGVETVDAPFRRTPSMIIRGSIDATVWYGGTVVPVSYLDRLEAHRAAAAKARQLTSVRAVVTAPADSAAWQLLHAADEASLLRDYRTAKAEFVT